MIRGIQLGCLDASCGPKVYHMRNGAGTRLALHMQDLGCIVLAVGMKAPSRSVLSALHRIWHHWQSQAAAGSGHGRSILLRNRTNIVETGDRLCYGEA